MKTIALVGASDFDAQHFQKLDAEGLFDTVIAVDKGYAHLASIDRMPDVAIGDFDSLGYVPDCANAFQHPSHKDKSDMELALDLLTREAVEPSFGHAAKDAPMAASTPAAELSYKIPCTTIYAYGALGGRIDHTIANIQLFARFAEQGFEANLIDNGKILRYLVGPGSYMLPKVDRGTVSVFSLSPTATGVSEAGLEYTLDKAELSNRSTLGLSNELVGKQATVEVQSGTLLIISPQA